jgi:RNA polymerase sigma-70 factor (ECF subfamily)
MESTGSPRVPIMDRMAGLYRSHFNLVWGALRRARVPGSDLDDLLQDVFIVVLRKLPTWNPAENPGRSPEEQERAWVYKITSYEVLNYRRRQRLRRVEPMDRTPEIPDPRNEAAAIEVTDELLVLLDTTTPERRAVFELVELEGFSVVAAAGILGITESNTHRRLGLARDDIRKAAEQRAKRDRDAGKKENSAFLLPFGVGAWLHFRDLIRPPEGTADRIWQRLQQTIAEIDRENDRPASPPPERPPLLPRLGRQAQAIGRSLQGVTGYLLAAIAGGAIVALLLLPRPEVRISILRLPGPVVLLTSPSAAPVEAPSANGSSDTAQAGAASAASEAIDPREARLIRQAQAAYAAGKTQEAIAALNGYEAQFPAGHLRNDARALRAALRDAGVK